MNFFLNEKLITNHHNLIKNGQNIQFHNFSIFFFLFLFYFSCSTAKKSIILYLDERPGKTVEALNSMPQQVVVLNGVCFFICFSNHAYCLFIYCRGQQHVQFVSIDEPSEKRVYHFNMKTEKYGEKKLYLKWIWLHVVVFVILYDTYCVTACVNKLRFLLSPNIYVSLVGYVPQYEYL